MGTKTQKEFRKNMKKYQKEGLIPENYYARRKFRYSKTSIGVTIVIILYALWRSGVIWLILSLFNFGSFEPTEVQPTDNYNLSPNNEIHYYVESEKNIFRDFMQI